MRRGPSVDCVLRLRCAHDLLVRAIHGCAKRSPRHWRWRMDDPGPKAVVLDLFDTLVKWTPHRLPQMEIRGKRVHTTIPWLVPDLERSLGDAFRLDRFIEAYTAVLNEIEVERA